MLSLLLIILLFGIPTFIHYSCGRNYWKSVPLSIVAIIILFVGFTGGLMWLDSSPINYQATLSPIISFENGNLFLTSRNSDLIDDRYFKIEKDGKIVAKKINGYKIKSPHPSPDGKVYLQERKYRSYVNWLMFPPPMETNYILSNSALDNRVGYIEDIK